LEELRSKDKQIMMRGFESIKRHYAGDDEAFCVISKGVEDDPVKGIDKETITSSP
jgi:hypothetical protein